MFDLHLTTLIFKGGLCIETKERSIGMFEDMRDIDIKPGLSHTA